MPSPFPAWCMTLSLHSQHVLHNFAQLHTVNTTVHSYAPYARTSVKIPSRAGAGFIYVAQGGAAWRSVAQRGAAWRSVAQRGAAWRSVAHC